MCAACTLFGVCLYAYGINGRVLEAGYRSTSSHRNKPITSARAFGYNVGVGAIDRSNHQASFYIGPGRLKTHPEWGRSYSHGTAGPPEKAGTKGRGPFCLCVPLLLGGFGLQRSLLLSRKDGRHQRSNSKRFQRPSTQPEPLTPLITTPG